MADWTKTNQTLLSHQAVTHPNTVQGSDLDVSAIDTVGISLFHASVEATANTNGGKFLIQGANTASGDEDWATLIEFQAQNTTADTEAMTATEPVGETVLAVASTSGFAANDILYIQDTGTVANSEWARCQEVVTNTSIDLVDGLTNEKDSSDVIWNDAEIWFVQLAVRGLARIRVVFQHEGATAANCHVKALGTSADAFA